MIFATIGTQAPFDRFVRMIDELAEGLEEEVVVQTIGLGYEPKNLKVVGFLAPDVFADYFQRARIVVAHAGMGTILSALRQGKPLIIVPQLASLGEHRNDHQMATAMRMDELGYVNVAYDKRQLAELLGRADLRPLKLIGPEASEGLVGELRQFIAG